MALEDDHHHCKVCGAVCGPKELTCSAVCATKRQQTVTQRRRLQYALYGAMILALFVLSLELRL